MHPPARQPTAQRGVERLIAGGEAHRVRQALATGNPGKLPPEHGKMINRLAHYLFLICSQVRFGPQRVKRMSGEEAVTDAHGSAGDQRLQ